VSVLLGDETGPGRRAASLAGPGTGTGTAAVGWSALPSPPTGTTALAALGAEVDAFVPSGSRLTVWSTAVGGLAWVRGSSQTVPIQYGSSG